MKNTISIKTLGCKLNQYESSLIAGQFGSLGYDIRPFGEMVDVVIVNTCTVTDRSDKKCRNYIRQGARFSRSGKAIVTGCLAERDSDGILNMPEVYAVFGNNERDELVRCVNNLSSSGLKSSETAEKSPLPLFHTRGYLKIQDGCDGQCAYCIVPKVRGSSRSREFPDIIEHARKLADHGCPELVLTGITIGKYSSSGRDIAGLVKELVEIQGKFRIRITSIEPNHVSDGLIDLLGSEKVCAHIHLPLQSGSDGILKLMNRPYTAAAYRALVAKVRKKFPFIAIGTDIIIGFPGEDAGNFNESLEMVADMGFSYVHQFSFSPRSGTPASVMAGACSEREIRERSDKLREVALNTGLRYRRMFLNKELSCVIERNRNGSGYTAVSDNYIKIKLGDNTSGEELSGKIGNVILLRAETNFNEGILSEGRNFEKN